MRKTSTFRRKINSEYTGFFYFVVKRIFAIHFAAYSQLNNRFAVYLETAFLSPCMIRHSPA